MVKRKIAAKNVQSKTSPKRQAKTDTTRKTNALFFLIVILALLIAFAIIGSIQTGKISDAPNTGCDDNSIKILGDSKCFDGQTDCCSFQKCENGEFGRERLAAIKCEQLQKQFE